MEMSKRKIQERKVCIDIIIIANIIDLLAIILNKYLC